MGLLDEVEAALRHVGPQCSFVGLHTDLSKADRADLDAMMANEQRYPATKIGEALRKRGLKVSDETVRRHRRGICACPR